MSLTINEYYRNMNHLLFFLQILSIRRETRKKTTGPSATVFCSYKKGIMSILITKTNISDCILLT